MQQWRITSCSATSCIFPVEGSVLQMYRMVRSIQRVGTTAPLTIGIVLALAAAANAMPRQLDIGIDRQNEARWVTR